MNATEYAKGLTPSERLQARNRLAKSIPKDQALLAAIKRQMKRDNKGKV